jgi:hypothetical protein
MKIAIRLRLPLPLLVVLATLALTVSPSFAETPGPGWELTSRVFPTSLAPGGVGTVEVEPVDIGEAASVGPVTITDTLPEGVTATGRAGDIENIRPEESEILNELWACTGNGPGASPSLVGATIVTCTNSASGFNFAGGGGTPNGAGGFNAQPELGIEIEAGPREVTGANQVTIAGGGAPSPASTSSVIKVGAPSAAFEFTGWDGWFSNANGTVDNQAGSHPYEATFSFDFATAVKTTSPHTLISAGGEVKNIVVNLPPGFVGDPNAVPQCTREELNSVRCPNASQIGSAFVLYSGGEYQNVDRVYNMVPPSGVPAEFGVSTFKGIQNYLDASVRSGSDYGIATSISDLPTNRQIVHVVTTLWGTPADPSHVIWRDANQGGCSQKEIETISANPEVSQQCKPAGVTPKPFLTLPTACGEASSFTVRADTWQQPEVWTNAEFKSHDTNDDPAGFTGCEDLVFGPSLTAAPDTASADTPTGLTVDVKPPLGGLENPEGDGSSDIKETEVALPQGVVINPGQAAGLQACQPAQDGLTTQSEKEKGEEDAGPPSCPNASKVGTVKAKTPLLEAAAEKELEGNVYVLQSNPPELKLLAAFAADGVYVKLVLNVHLNEATGQLTTTVANIPELPVSEFKLAFSGGAQAALDTPAQCGTYETTSNFTPWSSPFLAAASPTSAFAISEGPGGGSCPSSPLPFSPSLTAGSTTDQAGGFTNFSLLLQRGDGQQRIERLQFKEPEGLAGMISSVPLCGEPQASSGECSEASKIGHAAVASGPGPYPLAIPQPGQPESSIFLTGPYEGAPFGLSIVTHVIAGPFNLGTIVTRAKIEVDPHTAQITVTTDPFPQIVDGVPTDLRLIDSVIDRPGFLFNPTNCTHQEFTGTAWGTPPPGAGGPGATAAISSPFSVGSCQSLKFAPQISFSTNGKTSKQNGADLITKVTYPSAPQGTYANVGSVKVELPKALPSRLTTLQKACLAKVFEANPAACPPESRIGYATVHTPVLPVPLTGPAIFVSHGGEAFPSLTMVLQGYGVTIDLVGTTFISKAGITSTTFKTVPDTPFSTFELVLPQGPYSALTANGNLCKQKLVMPNEWVGANEALLRQDSTVNVTGCREAIAVVGHKVRGKTATIQVKVPAAGKLVASGKGLSKASKQAKGASTLTVNLTLTNGEAALLSRHKGRKLKAKINLTFTPKKGKELKTATTVIVG